MIELAGEVGADTVLMNKNIHHEGAKDTKVSG
jgi:hypothetical protein